MAWSASKTFMAYVTDSLNRTAAFDINSDTFKLALFDNTITPSQTVASASAAFGAGVWASGEVFQAIQYPTGGVALTSVTSTFASNVYTFTSANITSGSAATLTCYGGLIYDTSLSTPVANQAVCYNYFGGVQTVTAGLLTLQVGGTGLMQWTG